MTSATQQRAHVEARGHVVFLEIGDNNVTMTPREAQRFAYYLARAYTRAGGLRRDHHGHLVLEQEAAACS